MTRRLPLLSLAALASCVTGGKLLIQADAVKNETEKARQQGAQRCAPRELALATANLEFARAEIDAGDPSRAREHLDVAEQAARKAVELSRDCVSKVTVKKPPVVVKKVQDTDGDGIPDDIDRCPRDPEDFDGFQDEDGCPDPDNDGDGIVDAMDACPNNPGPLENRGCPVLDRDGDGIADWEDKCPDQAGTPESGGCAELDADGDGIPDRLDKCPKEPGPPPDGCPKKYALVVVRKDRIELKQQLKFATGKFQVLKASFPVLDQVAQVLKDNPSMKVRVEGHTDNVGSDSANLKLSQKRADGVKTYLVKKGVDPDRLLAVGYGPTKPLFSNHTAKGRAQNRRTEFRIAGPE